MLNKEKLNNLAGEIWKSAERLRGKLVYHFREGNGRLSRLLAMIMALQAGLDNDEPMKAVFRQVLIDRQRDFA